MPTNTNQSTGCRFRRTTATAGRCFWSTTTTATTGRRFRRTATTTGRCFWSTTTAATTGCCFWSTTTAATTGRRFRRTATTTGRCFWRTTATVRKYLYVDLQTTLIDLCLGLLALEQPLRRESTLFLGIFIDQVCV
jgi:hypothetical protein